MFCDVVMILDEHNKMFCDNNIRVGFKLCENNDLT